MNNKRSQSAKAREVRKKEKQKQNVEDCCRAFSVLAAYWGIDAYTVNHITASINMHKLNHAKQLHIKGVKISFEGSDLHVGMVSIPEKIEIKDSVVNSMHIYTHYDRFCEKYVSNVSITLVNSDDNNIVTRGMEDVNEQLKSVSQYLLENYGIQIYSEKATFKTLELAFNLRSNIEIPKRVRQIIDECFTNRKGKFYIIGDYVYGGRYRTPVARIMGTEMIGNKRRMLANYYKSREMKDKKEVPSIFDDTIYRLELRLKSNIKDYLGTDLIAHITDYTIADAIQVEINYAHKRYAKRVMNSVYIATKLFTQDLAEGKGTRTHNSANDILHMMESMENENDVASIIDVEQFIYMKTHTANQARDVKGLINKIRKMARSNGYTYLVNMDGWRTEEICNLMLSSLYDEEGDVIIGTPKYELASEANINLKTAELHEFSLTDETVYIKLVSMMQNKQRYKYFKELAE